MLRNSKPIISELNEELVLELNKMGFGKYYDSCYREIDDINCKAFYKSYSCCGGKFKLHINIESPYISWTGKEIKPIVCIRTPYDSWWSDDWTISEFTKDIEKFQNELKNDLQKLRKLGIIS